MKLAMSKLDKQLTVIALTDMAIAFENQARSDRWAGQGKGAKDARKAFRRNSRHCRALISKIQNP